MTLRALVRLTLMVNVEGGILNVLAGLTITLELLAANTRGAGNMATARDNRTSIGTRLFIGRNDL